ncbi:MAG: PAS domain-containing protein [Nitratireductor sp.]|nr:PAS domain-containing protein [Nitratireductor sp.]
MSEAEGISRSARLLLLSLIAIPVILFAGVSWHLRQEALREGYLHVQHTVRIFEEHALRVFEAQQLIADNVDRYIAGMDWETIRNSQDLHHFLKNITATSPHVDGLWLVPPDGRTANSADFFPFPDVSVTDREYFQAARQADEIHFGEMIRGRTKGTLNFNLSRRVSPRDSFNGVILVTASLRYFTDFWAKAAHFDESVAGLFRSDGKILARFPAMDNLPGRLSDQSELFRAMAAGSNGGVHAWPSSLDGSTRIYAFSRIGNTPVYIGYGVEEAAVLAQWRRNLAWHGAIALTAALLLAGVVFTVLRQGKQLSAAARSWRETAGELRAEAGRRLRAEDVAAEKQKLLDEINAVTSQRAAILDNMAEGVAAFDAAAKVTYCNGAAGRILRLADDEVPDLQAMAAEGRLSSAAGRTIRPQQTPIARLLRGRAVQTQALRISFADGSAAWCRFLGSPLRDNSGEVTGGVLTFTDVTQQRSDEERRDLLTRELDHRVRNMLATIQAMVRMSASNAATTGALVESLTGRIEAMARTHGMLSKSGWSGVALRQVVNDELAPYASGGRVVIDGPHNAVLPPKEALDLALVLHELATNAAKYGALSTTGGKVTVKWRLEPGEPNVIAMTWRESGGPPVTRPARHGFGTTLVLNAFRDKDAGVRLDYETGGIICHIRVPLRRTGWLRPAQSTPAAVSERTTDARRLDGLRVFIAEDEQIVQIDVAGELEAAGAVVAATASTAGEASLAARQGEFDAALLDVNLHGESIAEAASILHARGVFILFATGYNDLDLLPPALRHLPRLQKPIARGALVRAFAAGMAAKAGKFGGASSA